MNEFFDKYADLTALALTLNIPLLLTIYLKTKARRRIRFVPVYFFVFGPSGILSFIFFHLFENCYRAVVSATAGHFVYNFHFYSLILFGLIVAGLGAIHLKACFDKCFRVYKANRSYLYTIALILFITAPLIPITPIAAVPSICCAISLLAFPFVCRKTPSRKDTEELTQYDSLPAITLQQ